MSKKQDIVEAATRILSRGGSDALTASALAREAGVSKANLFHHFQSLDDIVLASFESFFMGLESVTGPVPGSLREWLLGIGAEATQVVADQAQLGGAYLAFLSRAKSDSRLHERLRQIAEMAEARFAETIAILAPHMGSEEVRALASFLLVAGDGLALHHDLFPGRAAQQIAGWRTFVDAVAPEEDQS